MTPGRKSNRLALFAAISLSACGLAACGGGGEGEAEAGAQAPAAAEGARTVRVARVETRPLQGGLSVSGVLVAREEAAVGT